MKAVYQRVSHASVTVDGKTVGAIQDGVLLLVGVTTEDTEAQAEMLAKKVANLRMFSDEDDKFNFSVLDIGGAVLAVSQFTLCANCSHGRRPEFMTAARPETAAPLFNYFVEQLRKEGVRDVQTGEFGASMKVELCNEGPVTLILNTDDWKK